MNTGLVTPTFFMPWMTLPGEGADVRPTVTADGGLVVHAAERDPVELAPQGAGDAAAERRLAHPGRADEAEDRALLVALELANGQVLEDPPLDLLEAVVVGVEYGAHGRDVGAVLALARPRQLDDPVEVRAHGPELRRAGLQRPQPPELLLGDLARLFRQARRRDAGREGVDVALAVLALPFAELALDGLHLLAQQVLALLLAHVALDLGVDALADLEDLAAPDHLGQHHEHASLHVQRGEDLRLLGHVDIEAGGHEVSQLAGRRDRVDLHAQLGRQPELIHHLVDRVAEIEEEGVELGVVRGCLFDGDDLDPDEGAAGRDGVEPRSSQPAEDDDDARALFAALASRPGDADDLRHDADVVEVGLRHAAQRFSGLALAGLPDEDGDGRLGVRLQVLRQRRVAKQDLHQRARKDHRVVQGEQRQVLFDFDRRELGSGSCRHGLFPGARLRALPALRRSKTLVGAGVAPTHAYAVSFPP